MNKTPNPLLKLSIGIDISKDKFNACIEMRYSDGQTKTLSQKEFGNRKGVFDALLSWVKRSTLKGYANIPTVYVMEATGIYYEPLAYYLDEQAQFVSVQLANVVKNFARSLNRKSKTDKIDAQILAQMGIERSLVSWERPADYWRKLKGCAENGSPYWKRK